MIFLSATRFSQACLFALAALGVVAMTPVPPASAQSIAVTVNGDPITTTEIEQLMQFLRIVHQPASRADALEQLIDDRLKLHRANRNGVDATETSLNQTFNQLATRAKTTTQALLAEFQRAKLSTDLIRTHLRSVSAWNEYVRSLNKSLSVSEEDITAAMAKDASLAKGETDYTLQQIVVVLPVGASPTIVEQRTREAQSLRQRFQDCASGLPLARALPDVAIKPPVTKKGTALTTTTKAALDQTQKGRLTSPSRTAAGIEMIAVCSKSDDDDKTSVRDNVQAQLLTDRLAKEADELFKDVRASAVIEKH